MDIKERVARLLLDELRTGEEQWYYISVAAEVFYGAFVLQAKGPTDAWVRMHALGWCPKDHSTETHGPIPESAINHIPESMRYKKLTREEAENIGN